MLEREVGNPFPTRKGIEGAIAMAGYMDDLVRERRAHPTDDMISHLVQAEVEREDGTIERLTDTEVGRFVLLLAAAGAETTGLEPMTNSPRMPSGSPAESSSS